MGQCIPWKRNASGRVSLTNDSGESVGCLDFVRQQQLLEMFSHEELEILRRRFDGASYPAMRLSAVNFEKLLPSELFRCFDLDSTKDIAFRDFCVGLAVGTFGSEADLSRFLCALDAGCLSTYSPMLAAFPALEDERQMAVQVKSFLTCFHSDASCLASPVASPIRAASNEAVVVLPHSWLSVWLSFTDSRSSRPGSIDCDSLFESKFHLKSGLLEGYDFVAVPAAVGRRLVGIYGCVGMSPPVRRLGELSPALVTVTVQQETVETTLTISGLVSLRDSVAGLAMTLATKHIPNDCVFELSHGDRLLVYRTHEGMVFRRQTEARDLLVRHFLEAGTVNLVLNRRDPCDSSNTSSLITCEGMFVAVSSVKPLWTPDECGHLPTTAAVAEDVEWMDLQYDTMSIEALDEKEDYGQRWLGDQAWIKSLNQWLGISGGTATPTANSNGIDSEVYGGISEVSSEIDTAAASSRKQVGLKNLGNTCFMNSVLQCLVHTEFLRNFFFSARMQRLLGRMGHQAGIVGQLEKLLRRLETSLEAVDPRKFKKGSDELAPEFSDRMQHDAHEYFCALLEMLHADLVRMSPASEETSQQSVVQEIFEGILSVHMRCMRCGDERKSHDVFRALPVPLAQDSARTLHVTHFLGREMRRVKVVGIRSLVQLFGRFLAPTAEVEDAQASANGKDAFTRWRFVENLSGRAGRVISASDRDEMIREMKDETELVLCEVDCGIIASAWRFRGPILSLRLGAKERKQTEVPGVLIVVQHRRGGDVFGVPFVFKTCEDADCGGVYRTLQERCMTYFGLQKLSKAVLTDSRGKRCGRSRCESRELCSGCEFPRFRRLGDLSALQAGKIYLAIDWDIRYTSRLLVPLLSVDKSKSQPRSISQCLESALEGEVMDDVECEKCMSRGAFFRKTQIDKYPEILVVVVKRFTFSMFGYAGKLHDLVRIEKELVDNANEYELYAVLNHEGSLSGSGHYTALVRDISNDATTWLLCDDAKLTVLGPELPEILSKSCYMLFYQKKKPRVATILTYSSSFPRSSSKIS